ncbi:MAG: LLM class flavin-dependent oxidoreductase, partial [Chryseolinea sp.]
DIHNIWTSEQQQTILNMLAYSFVGSQSKVASEIQGFVEQTKIDEIIVTSHIYDQGARLKSMTLFSEVMREKVLT